MSADGSDDTAAESDEFVAEYEPATAADVIEEAEPAADENDEDEDEGAVAGSFAPDVAVTPQRPARENVIFVALGVYLTLLAFAETLPAVGTAPATIAGLTVLVAVGTLLCYGVLLRTTPDT
jgi:hypothetical protein